MEIATKKQVGCIRALIARSGLDSQKGALVSGFTSGRTEHTSEMSVNEAKELIQYLNRQSAGRTSSAPTGMVRDASRDNIMRSFYAIAYEMNWHEGALPPEKSRLVRIKLEAWAMKQKFKKELADHDTYELGVLLHIFRNGVYASFLKGL